MVTQIHTDIPSLDVHDGTCYTPKFMRTSYRQSVKGLLVFALLSNGSDQMELCSNVYDMLCETSKHKR